MGFGSVLGGLNEGLGQGVSLYNALQQGPAKQQMALQQAALGQQQLQDQMNKVPVKLGGQTFMLPQAKAAEFAAEIESRKAMANAMLGRTQMQQDFNVGKPDAGTQSRIAAVQSIVPIHNTAMALWNANWADKNGDPSALATAMTQAKTFLASNPITRPYAETLGNDPANIPAVYDAVVQQAAMEQPRLESGSMRVPEGPELQAIKSTIYPGLDEKPNDAYGKFNHFSEAYIKSPYEAALARLNQAADPVTGKFTNQFLERQSGALQKQLKDTTASLYQMPGYGTSGTPVPEIQGVIPSLQTNGNPLVNAVKSGAQDIKQAVSPITSYLTGQMAKQPRPELSSIFGN